MREVRDALPESHRAVASDATRRTLIDPETALLSRAIVSRYSRYSRSP